MSRGRERAAQLEREGKRDLGGDAVKSKRVRVGTAGHCEATDHCDEDIPPVSHLNAPTREFALSRTPKAVYVQVIAEVRGRLTHFSEKVKNLIYSMSVIASNDTIR
jgi:hypothetical protein